MGKVVRPGWRKDDRAHPRLKIKSGDMAREKFLKAAILARPPGRTPAALEVAIRLYINMDPETGEVKYQTSIREMERLLGMRRDTASAALAYWIGLGLIERELRRGSTSIIRASTAVLSLAAEDAPHSSWCGRIGGTTEVVGSEEPLVVGSEEPLVVGCEEPLVVGCEEPPTQAPVQYSSTLSKAAAAHGVSEEVPTSTSLPHHSMPEDLKTSNASGGRVVCGADQHTEYNHYGYGTPIAGLNGHTNEVVDQLVALEGGIVINKDPAWVTVKEAVRQTTAERVMAALLDLRAAKDASKLKLPPMRALLGFARALTQEAAVVKLSKPAKRVNPLEMFGMRR